MNLKSKLKCSLLNKKHPFSVSKGHSISRNIRFDSNGASFLEMLWQYTDITGTFWLENETKSK